MVRSGHSTGHAMRRKTMYLHSCIDKSPTIGIGDPIDISNGADMVVEHPTMQTYSYAILEMFPVPDISK